MEYLEIMFYVVTGVAVTSMAAVAWALLQEG
jgi:hypothetical protein